MTKMKQLEIQCKMISTGEFFLYAFDDGYATPADEWVPLLFQWHKESHYGTKVERKKLPFRIHKGTGFLEGVVIDALDALELFGTEPFNGFVRWNFDDFSQTMLGLAPVIYENIIEKNWVPTFRTEEDRTTFSWEVPSDVWEEFVPSFWEEDVSPFFVDPPVDIDNPRPFTIQELANTLFQTGVDGYIKRRPALYRKWQQQKQLLENPAFKGLPLSDFFDPKRFLTWTGLSEEETPFSVGLQLKEPEEEGDWWKLGLVLIDRNNRDRTVPLSSSGKGKRIPKKWEPFLAEVVTETERIARLFPSLMKEEREEGKQDGTDSFETRHRLKEELTEDEAWKFLTETSETLLLLGIDILLPSWWEALKQSNPSLKARVKAHSAGPAFVGMDTLMDFEWRLAMNGVDLSEEEFRRLVDEKRKLIHMNGRWMKLDPAFIKKMQAMMEKAEREGMRVQDLLQQELLYGEREGEPNTEEEQDPRMFAKIRIELQPKLRTFVRNLADMTDIPRYEVPQNFRGMLRPYQEKGMSWLYFLRQHRFGACLADDMGLGKTIQFISYLLLVKEREPDTNPALIICPTSVLGNWQRELERFAPDLGVYLHYGPNRPKGDAFKKAVTERGGGKVDVVLTTYGLAHLDFEELSAATWGTIVLDEAQNIKNADTKQSRAIRKLKGTHHIALTGTPMENRLAELWSIFDFINKGYLGSLSRFQQRFIQPIERDRDKEKIEELRKLIRPFLLRRTKRDEEVSLNLPDKLEQKEYCPLTVEQAALYEQLVKDTFEQMTNVSGFERKGYVLRLLGKLKQLCNHPALYLKQMDGLTNKDIITRSAKMEKLTELTETVLDRGESGLIFTQYIGMGNMIKAVLEKQYNISVPFLNGSMPKQKRDQLIAAFQQGEFPFLLLSLKAGGTGLNLTAANHVIHYDRWWNPAVENQATDRAYRIGQTKFVHVHKFITNGTLEEKIDRMLEKKQALNDEIIQSDQWLADMDDDELYDILRLDG